MKRTTITVRRGQIYRVGRKTIKITGVSKGDQPKATYARISRSGATKYKGHYRAWLTHRNGVWAPPASWNLVG